MTVNCPLGAETDGKLLFAADGIISLLGFDGRGLKALVLAESYITALDYHYQ